MLCLVASAICAPQPTHEMSVRLPPLLASTTHPCHGCRMAARRTCPLMYAQLACQLVDELVGSQWSEPRSETMTLLKPDSQTQCHQNAGAPRV